MSFTICYDCPSAIAASNCSLDLPYDLNEEDVIIAAGVSGCLHLVFDALLDEGDNILVPSATIPLYQVMIEEHTYCTPTTLSACCACTMAVYHIPYIR